MPLASQLLMAASSAFERLPFMTTHSLSSGASQRARCIAQNVRKIRSRAAVHTALIRAKMAVPYLDTTSQRAGNTHNIQRDTTL